MALAVTLVLGADAFAQRRGGGGGGGRGGGGGFSGGRAGAGGGGYNRQANVNRMQGAQPARGNINTVNNANRANVNRANVNTGNINRTNVNNVNVNRGGYGGYRAPVPVPVPVPVYGGGYYGPSAGSVAAGVAVGAAAGMVTGAYLASLPPKTVVISALSGQVIYKSNGSCYSEAYQGNTLVYQQVPCP